MNADEARAQVAKMHFDLSLVRLDTTIRVAPHPLSRPMALEATLPVALGALPSPPWLLDLLRPDAPAPLQSDDAVRKDVRDLLRHGGYKPTGRGKPASEYLLQAASEARLGAINAAVDAGNAVSLHSGLPISVVDAGLVRPVLHVDRGRAGERYVFNTAGHAIELDGLLLMRDADGPCANAVKDAMRSKTGPDTTELLCVVWVPVSQAARGEAAMRWLAELFRRLGAFVHA